MGIGFVFGISLGITNTRARTVARVLAFVPPVVAYLLLRPATFAQTVPYQLSTSQLIGLISAITVSYFYARFWEDARKNPRLAMSLGDAAAIRELKGEPEAEAEVEEEETEEDAEDEDKDKDKDAPPPTRTGKGKKKGLAAKPKKDDAPEPKPAEPKADPEPEPGTS
jgi:hypothetical protein